MNFSLSPIPTRSVPTQALLGLLVALALLDTGAIAVPGGRDSLGIEAGPPPLLLDETPQSFVPKRPRSQADRDRLEALSLFAAARMHQQREEPARALRLYQRAFRLDPEAVSAVREIVGLAFDLDRHSEAVRYALKAVELEDTDPVLLRRLGVYLTEKGDLAGAAKLYERAIAASVEQPPELTGIVLRMEAGRLHHLLGDYARAADRFAQVRDALKHPDRHGLDPQAQRILLDKPGPTYSLFGECFLRAKRWDEAREAFEKAHQLAPNEPLLNYHRAQLHAAQGDASAALGALLSALKHELPNVQTAPYELLATLLEQDGKAQELLSRLEKLHAAQPNNTALAYFLADKRLEAKQYDKAESLYRELLQSSPTLTGYRSLVSVYLQTRRPTPLLEVLGQLASKAGSLEPLGSEVEQLLGDPKLVDQMVEAVRKSPVQEAVATETAEIDYGIPLAAALLSLARDETAAAADCFNRAIRVAPDQKAGVLLLWGIELLLADHPAEAAAVFQRAVDETALPKDNPTFHFYLASALALDDRIDAALAAARKAVELDDDSPRYHSRVGWILYHGERYDAAREAYRQLLDRFDADHASPETRDILREARLVLSSICVLQEDSPQAQEWLEQVLDEFPDDVGALNDLGYLWADQNKHLDRALRMIQYAVDAEPENLAYRDSLGWALYRLGRYEEAVGELRTAAAGDPDSVVLDHLGDALLKVGRAQEAIEQWRRAAEVYRQQNEPEKAKQIEVKIRQNGGD